jgi:DNA-binding NtrC family response regulator
LLADAHVANLLIVDDDLDVSGMLAFVLEAEGHAVRTANDGAQGLEMVRKPHPELVVLDVEMPILDGPGMALQMFIEDCGLDEIPIVLVSGYADLPKIAQRVGTPYVLPKPFDVDELLSVIQLALTERRAPRPDRTRTVVVGPVGERSDSQPGAG